MGNKVFNSVSEDATAPAREWFSITPHDSTPLARKCRSIFVGTGGDVVAVAENGDEVTFTLVDGTILPIQPRLIKETGTTATGLIGLY